MTSTVRQERTFTRDLRYSQWHRNRLPAKCCCTDLDWIEYRYGEGIVAFIEAKLNNGRVTEFQRTVFLELEQLTGVPFYVVRYNEELTEFMVMRLNDNFTDVFDEAEYIEWISNLSRPTVKRTTVEPETGFYNGELRS